jgi:acetylornithine/succinyldiaminopimelate/putrescine aminotransferase/acyl-CoA synthetase (AMP-forming)/AMP-acid ligase II/predicted amino acid dehydrogenase/acyl carrier protein
MTGILVEYELIMPVPADATWNDLLSRRAAETPKREALIHLSQRNRCRQAITYGELDVRARSIAGWLGTRDAPGDRVLIVLPSCNDYVAALFGTLYAGRIPVTAYPPKSSRNLARIKSIVADCRPSVIIATPEAAESLGRAAADLRFGGRLATIDEMISDQTGFAPVAVRADQVALLQYTSGSTATPKGVMVSHRNLLHNCELLRAGMAFGADSVVGSWLPMHHDMGLIGKILCSLYSGVPCVYLSPVDFVKSPYLWLQLISEYRCTISGAPNFAYDLCVSRVTDEQLATLDLSSWRVAWNGAEPVRRRTLDAFYERFAAAGLRRTAQHPCYGLAEGTLFVTAQDAEEEPWSLDIDRDLLARNQARTVTDPARAALPYVSIGHPRLDTVVRIVDPETRRECADGRIGEIWTSSPSVAIGYWERPEESKEIFRARLADDDGLRYLRTGDLGFAMNGEFYVTGRSKDVFIVNGRNIYPQDLESTIERCHPILARSAVFGVGRDDGTVAVLAACELARGVREDVAACREACLAIMRALAEEHDFSCDELFLVGRDAIRKTTSGKVQRGATRDAYLAGEMKVVYRWTPPHQAAGPAGISPARLLQALREEIGRLVRAVGENISPQARLAEFGLSSLQTYELVIMLEDLLGRSLQADLLYAGNPTLSTLVERLLAADRPSEAPALAQSEAPLPAAGSAAALYPVLRMDQKYQQQVVNQSHPFIAAINPEFGRKLSQLKLDKEYVRGEGAYLYDTDGVRYLDFLSQYGALPLGHNHPAIWSAVERFRREQLPAMVQPALLGPASRLAERLVALAPGDIAYVTFANSGAEAVEAALKLARSTTGRRKILSTVNGFHGKTLGALSATGRQKYRNHFGVCDDDFQHVPYNDVVALKAALAGGEYAGFIVEPIQGEAGVVMPQPGYLQAAQELCRKAETLFIVDEVQTGLGRTGSIFYCDQLGLEPDIITLAKGLGGGLLPIGACLSSRRVYNDEFGSKHTSTFAGNGLACTVGLQVLDVLLADDAALLARVRETGTHLKRKLLALRRKYPQLVREVRGTGFMLGVHIAVDRYAFGSGLLAAVMEEEFITSLLMSYMLNNEHVRVAFTLNSGNVLRIQPPLIACWEDCELLLGALDRTLGVLATRNTGLLVSHIVGRSPAHRPESPVYADDFVKPVASATNHFAFLLHPLTPRTYVDFDRSLGGFTDPELVHLGKVFGDNFEPFLGGENLLLSNTGDMLTGEFWVVPRTARDLVRMPPAQSLLEVQAAMDKAVAGNARWIGLGAYTSTVTQGGLALSFPPEVTVTTGNAFTALVGFLSVVRILGAAGRPLADASVAIVGATGAIGRALSLLFGACVRELVLVGNPQHPASSQQRMERVAAELIAGDGDVSARFGCPPGPLQTTAAALRNADAAERIALLRRNSLLQISIDWAEALPRADVVITATNSPDARLSARHLKQNAVVCDIARPSNVDAAVREQRPDVFVYDGGVVRLPAGMVLGLHTDLAEGLCYACMAETMLLALEGNRELAVLGSDIRLQELPQLWALASRHGFDIHVPPHERPVTFVLEKTAA